MQARKIATTLLVLLIGLALVSGGAQARALVPIFTGGGEENHYHENYEDNECTAEGPDASACTGGPGGSGGDGGTGCEGDGNIVLGDNNCQGGDGGDGGDGGNGNEDGDDGEDGS